MGQNERIFVCLSFSINLDKIEANKIAESFPTYRILAFKFDSLDATYKTSKARIR